MLILVDSQVTQLEVDTELRLNGFATVPNRWLVVALALTQMYNCYNCQRQFHINFAKNTTAGSVGPAMDPSCRV